MTSDGLPPAPRLRAGWDRQLTRGPVPPAVRNAVWLMLARVTISVAAIIVLITTRGTFRRRYLEHNPDASKSAVNTALTSGIVFGIVVLLFYAFLALQVWRGVSWARIVTWVIAGLGILGALLSLDQPDTTASRVLGSISGLLDVAVVVLLALPESNRYFRAGRPLG